MNFIPIAWKPQHGTNKDVWTAIVDRFNASKSYTGFNTNISWESAKDQFISLLDRQRRQKKKGGYAAKLDFVNAKIDGAPSVDDGSDISSSAKKSRPSFDIDDRHKKFPRKTLNPGILFETSDPSGRVDLGNSAALIIIDMKSFTNVSIEIEKLRLAREKEREEAQKQRDERFLGIIESHLESNRAVMDKVVDLLEQVKELLPKQDPAKAKR